MTHKLKSTKWIWVQPVNPFHPYESESEIEKPSATKTKMKSSKVCVDQESTWASARHATIQRPHVITLKIPMIQEKNLVEEEPKRR